MKRTYLIAAVALAAGLSLSDAAQAQIAGVDNICEIDANGVVNTVKVRLMSLALLDYTFKKIPGGQQYIYPAGQLTSAPRKFALPAGSYTFTYKHPNSPPVGTFHKTVVVKPYSVVGGDCVFTPIEKQVGKTGQVSR